MSADADLNAHQFDNWVHTTPYRLKVGTSIVPGGRPANFDNDRSGAYNYMSNDDERSMAYDYALHEQGYKARATYDVEPAKGAVIEPDPNSGDPADFRTTSPLTVLGIRSRPRGGYWPPEAS